MSRPIAFPAGADVLISSAGLQVIDPELQQPDSDSSARAWS
jgi:hypothetical protein